LEFHLTAEPWTFTNNMREPSSFGAVNTVNWSGH
jgi:hypothetical protein